MTGRDCIGAVAILDEQIFTSRDVQKADARPGGYIATGGHGGIIGRIGHPGLPQFSFKTLKRHTHNSLVNSTGLPSEVQGSKVQGSTIKIITVKIKDAEGNLLPAAIPKVTIVKHARYLPEDTTGNRRRRSRYSRAHRRRICVMRRWLALSPKAQRLSAP